MTSISDVIGHYQRSIEKSAHDEARLLHCIEKLYKLPITVEHLQQTGIGKTVNALRKYDKEVGIAAKALVAKWKAMVAAEEELVNVDDTHKVNGNDPSNSDNENYSGSHNSQESESGNHSNPKYKQSSSRNEKTNVDRKERKHKENGKQDSHSHNQHSTSDSKKTHNVLSDRHNRDKPNSSNSNSSKHHREKHLSDDNRTSQNHQSDHRKNEKLKSLSNQSSRKAPTPEPAHESTPPVASDDNLYENDYDDEDEEKLIIDTEQTKEKIDETEKHSNRSKSSKSSSRHKSSSSKRSSSEDKQASEHENKKKSKSEGRDRDKREESKSSSSKSHSDEKRDKDKSSDRHHQKSSNKDEENNSHRQNGESKSSSSSKSKSSDKSKVAEKHKSDSRKSSKAGSSEISSSTKKSSKRKHESTDESESAEEQNSPKKSKTARNKNDDGIDNTMGNLSFEEALGMMAPPAKSASSKLKSPKGNAVPSKTSSATSSSRTTASSSSSNRSKTPPLLTTKVKLEPLDPKLSLELPTISPNYKPLPLNPTVMDCVFANNTAAKPTLTLRRLMTDDEALQSGISSKTIRTKIYSGMRTGALLQVPSLFNICIRVLQKNIDALEYTGGVPFEVLKPVLDLASPEQLQTFEEFNPYLYEDTDDLWRVHCCRRYKTQKRQEMESWREMYARCKEQEEERLNMLTKNISYQQKQITAPIKRTQLAYLDVDVKPPRNVQRKQEQYGTKGRVVATPAARVEALSKITPTAAKIGDTRLRVAADVRDHAQASTQSRPKKAPLMQKTLQLMKGRFKR